MKLLSLAVVLLVGISVSGADQWAYFQPELVTEFRCSVIEAEYVVNGTGRGDLVWEATGKAKRKGGPDWEMTVGVFPPTLKGRHSAEKSCSRWMDEASKRVKAAAK